jgi:CRP-like cAMP-binding protein
MKKVLRKSQLKIINNSIKANNDKTIKTLADLLKKKEEEHLSEETLFHQQETLTIIKMILSKIQKNETDIFVLSCLLKTLTNFMQLILQGQPEDYNPIPILKQISYDLECEEYQKNTFVMKVGDYGKNFYVILSGSVSVLVPKNIAVKMTRRQYLEHLKMLYKYEEKKLFERTFYNNVGTYSDIKIETIEKEIEKDKVSKKDENLILELKDNEEEEEENEDEFTIEKYIKEINAEDIFIEKYNSNEVKIVGYYKVTDLPQGSSFGETALINDNQQRTASIFVKEHSIFGTLSSHSYKKCLKNIQENNKKNDIDFIYSSHLFYPITIFVFTQNYWNYFINKKVCYGEYLFKQGQNRDEIYFLKEGEFKLITYNLTHKKVNLIISQLGNFKLEKIDYADVGKGIDISLNYAKNGDILGMNDLLYNNQFFCSAICTSKKASFFAINTNILNNMFKYYKKVHDNYKKMEIDKKILMIQRLQGIKYSNKNSLSGEFRKDSENLVFWKEKDKEKELKINDNLDKKYNKLQTYKTVFNKFELTSFLNKETENEKKIDIFNISKIKMNKKSLPPVSSSNSINLTPNININHRAKIKIYQRNFNTFNSSNYTSKVNSSRNLDINIRKKILDIGMTEIEKRIKKNTKDDLITKLIFGKKIKNINDSDYFLVSPEMEKTNDMLNKNKEYNIKSPKILKKSINYFQRGSSSKKNILLKELSGIKQYNDKKRKIAFSLNSDRKNV